LVDRLRGTSYHRIDPDVLEGLDAVRRKEVPMNWFLTALKKYAIFEGRARRAEYWYFVLFMVLIGVAAKVVDRILGTPMGENGVVSTLCSLGLFLPALAVAVRRLHDTNRSGWWLLLGLIPVVGAIVLIVFYATAGVGGVYRYGPVP
jgi:uncharacterized membrane protein YhaH (DUF805 family)